MKVKDMKVNNKEIEEAKLNNRIVYKKNKSLILENIIYNADFILFIKLIDLPDRISATVYSV